jgi:hypothetical protein
MDNLLIDSIQKELKRQTGRQIARLFSDLKGFPIPSLVEARIKEGFYELELEVNKTIKQEKGNYDYPTNK